MKSINKSTIIICSIVRNAERGLQNNIPVIKRLCKMFADYRVVIYENDSVDKTKVLLSEWMEEDKAHVVALLNNTDGAKTIPNAIPGGVNPFYSRKRIAKIVQLRNYYMEYVDDHHLTADYLMVVDLDVAKLNLESILSSFDDGIPEWDAVTAYEFSTAPSLKRRYHDTYALVQNGKSEEAQTEKSIRDAALQFAEIMKIGDWVKVDSAFGGLAIYRFDCVQGLRYQVIDNADNKVEVKCEYQSISRQMKDRGFDAVYVNPKMTLKYQNLTLKIVWNSLQRMWIKKFEGGVNLKH